MRTISTAIAASLLLLAGCDRGTAPECTATDGTCPTSRTSDVGGTGGTTTTPPTGNTGTGSTGTGSGLLAGSALVFDTGAAIVTLRGAEIVGRPSIQGGDKRQIAFFIDSDNSLRIIGSSDGDVQSTFNRMTIYDVYILSDDSLSAKWLTSAEPGRGSSSVSITRDASEPTQIRWALSFRFYTLARPVETRLVTMPGAALLVKVKARSGYAPNSAAEDSIPQLATSETKPMMKYGPNLLAIGSDPFLIEMP